MNAFDHIIKMMQDAERALSAVREFERMNDKTLQQIARGFQEKESLQQATISDIAKFRLDGFRITPPALDQMNPLKNSYASMESAIANAHRHVASVMSREAELMSAAVRSAAVYRQDAAIDTLRMHESISAAAENALKSHFADVAAASVLAQTRLLRVPWDTIGSMTSINPSEFTGIKERFAVMAESYQSLALSFDVPKNLIASFPPIVSGGPPLEILMGAKVLGSLSRPIEREEDEDSFRQTEADYEDGIEWDTNRLLEEFNPQLKSAWRGAKEAFRSDNPDRGRHVSISLREAITHTLHALAPDQAIKSWTIDPSHFHNDRPTREARVLFICRNINSGPFSTFVTKDVRANIEFIDLFHRGTHDLTALFSDAQLRALIVKTESLLRFLLLTSRENN